MHRDKPARIAGPQPVVARNRKHSPLVPKLSVVYRKTVIPRKITVGVMFFLPSSVELQPGLTEPHSGMSSKERLDMKFLT